MNIGSRGRRQAWWRKSPPCNPTLLWSDMIHPSPFSPSSPSLLPVPYVTDGQGFWWVCGAEGEPEICRASKGCLQEKEHWKYDCAAVKICLVASYSISNRDYTERWPRALLIDMNNEHCSVNTQRGSLLFKACRHDDGCQSCPVSGARPCRILRPSFASKLPTVISWVYVVG